jgi:DnaK suppressor protein
MKTRSKGRVATRRPVATTSEIIPDQNAAHSIPRKWHAHFRRLTELRHHLLRTRGDLKSDADDETPTYSLHMADAATDNYDRDFALSMLSAEQNAIYEIEQALQRIQDGTYGRCEMTGKVISPERLEAIPWTRFSTEAETELERGGQITQAKLGDIARVPKESTEHAARETEDTSEEKE